MVTERSVGDDHIGNVLAGVVRLVSGAVAVSFVPKYTHDSAVIFSSIGHTESARR